MKNFNIALDSYTNEDKDGSSWSKDNPFKGTDDEESGDFYEAYLQGYYYEPENNEDDE